MDEQVYIVKIGTTVMCWALLSILIFYIFYFSKLPELGQYAYLLFLKNFNIALFFLYPKICQYNWKYDGERQISILPSPTYTEQRTV